MTLLLLGGTAEARAVAEQLHARGVDVIYSIAGLVRQPQLDCRIESGGFSRHGGLDAFCRAEGVDAVLDATHPYAAHMSCTAREVTRALQIPLWRYQRSPWQAGAGDDWRAFEDWRELPAALADRRAVFLTAGQIGQDIADAFARTPGQKQWLRSATAPGVELPESMTWIEAIGPFAADDERALFEQHGFDAVVSKNSGGAATAAKLDIARERGVPVWLLERPRLPAADDEFAEVPACVEFVVAQQRETA